MKALILAAGLGTRLRPYTDKIPKCLFPIDGKPNLDHVISRLIRAGCTEITVNTHHLSPLVEAFLRDQAYAVPVCTRHEPKLLGTGGTIKSLADFWNDAPFLVVNGDVVCDVDPAELYAFHLGHGHAATLCLVDDARFNTVGVDANGWITGFDPTVPPVFSQPIAHKTFTGFQVLDPLILDFIPRDRFSSSIAAFTRMMAKGHKVMAFQPRPLYWKDIGTPADYTQTVYDHMVKTAFEKAFPGKTPGKIEKTRIKGDGSDRAWFRLSSGHDTLILADHGISVSSSKTEAESFVRIGNHLFDKHLPVPRIHLYDIFSGLVFVEDLGNVDLETFVQTSGDPKHIAGAYHRVVENIIRLSVLGREGFDPSWTFQTPCYDVPMILEKECRYFTDVFLNGYLNLSVAFASLAGEFTALAREATRQEVFGFMHRDCQHRNIMTRNGEWYFIDFQSGRIGPVTYDLASLFIDPYVNTQKKQAPDLVEYAFETYAKHVSVSRNVFMSSYRACALTRNLQILGAYAYLSRSKNKPDFEKYITPALKTLQNNLSEYNDLALPKLSNIVNAIKIA